MNTSRKRCREGEHCTPATVAQGFSCLVQHGGYTVAELVEVLGRVYDVHVTREQLYEWSNPYRDERHLACPLRVVVALTRLQRNPVVLDLLARGIGYRLEAMPTDAAVLTLEQEFLDVADVHGLLARSVRDATADRVIDESERAHLRATISQAKRELADLEAAVEAGGAR